MPINIPPQTPLYHAIHKERYSRQQLIQDIEKETGRKLIAYIANLRHRGGGIDQNDVLAFGDLLQGQTGDLDLLLQSPGGDIDVAEKIIYMCRSNTERFRVIVLKAPRALQLL